MLRRSHRRATVTTAAEDLIFSMPCRSNGDGDYEVIDDFVIDDWLAAKLKVRGRARTGGLAQRKALLHSTRWQWVHSLRRDLPACVVQETEEELQKERDCVGHLIPGATRAVCMITEDTMLPGEA